MKYLPIIGSIVLIALVGWAILSYRTFSLSARTSPTTESTLSKSAQEQVSASATPEESQSATSNATVTGTPSYTAAEVSAHATPASCWTSINGKVYDLTSWVSRHPGGPEAIEQLCGTDGSAKFNAQHGGQARPERELEQFFIGILK